jgi:Protein of unknown function DUF72
MFRKKSAMSCEIASAKHSLRSAMRASSVRYTFSLLRGWPSVPRTSAPSKSAWPSWTVIDSLSSSAIRLGSRTSHTPRALAFERERNLVNVIADAPQGPSNSIPAVWEVTCPDLAIVRLHGKNHETWNKKGLKTSAERFNYDYVTEELSDIADSVRKLAEKVGGSRSDP